MEKKKEQTKRVKKSSQLVLRIAELFKTLEYTSEHHPFITNACIYVYTCTQRGNMFFKIRVFFLCTFFWFAAVCPYLCRNSVLIVMPLPFYSSNHAATRTSTIAVLFLSPNTHAHIHTHVLTSKAGAQSRTWSCFALLCFFFSSSLSLSFPLCVHILFSVLPHLPPFFSFFFFCFVVYGALKLCFFCCCFAPVKPIFMCNTGSRTTHFHFS